MNPSTGTSAAAALRAFEIFRSFSDAQIDALAAIAERKNFSRDQHLYEQGDSGCGFMLVAAGTLEARRATPFGDQKVAALGRGDLVGEISSLDDKPRSSMVVALNDGFVWRFELQNLRRTLRNDPALELELLRVFCLSLVGKIRQANQVMSQIMAPGESVSDGLLRAATGSEGQIDAETKKSLLEEQGVAADEMRDLGDFAVVQCFASGDTIFSEGDPCDALYIIAEGSVRISRRIPTLGEEALAVLRRGEVFGEMAWIDRGPRSADAIAHAGGCTVLTISRAELEGSMNHHSGSHAAFLRTLSKLLCRRLRHMNDQLVAYRTMVWF
jgi:CRP-like cAMP-binding protein